MTLSIIAAIGINHELGLNNKLLWQLPDDLKHFRNLTINNTIIMGRKTYESIGKALPLRRNIILSRQNIEKPDCEVFHTLESALKAVANDKEAFVIGGAELYKLALPLAQKMYLTQIEASANADAYFPRWNPEEWKKVSSEKHTKDESHVYEFSYETYERIN